jgi:hypothetical protein
MSYEEERGSSGWAVAAIVGGVLLLLVLLAGGVVVVLGGWLFMGGAPAKAPAARVNAPSLQHLPASTAAEEKASFLREVDAAAFRKECLDFLKENFGKSLPGDHESLPATLRALDPKWFFFSDRDYVTVHFNRPGPLSGVIVYRPKADEQQYASKRSGKLEEYFRLAEGIWYFRYRRATKTPSGPGADEEVKP